MDVPRVIATGDPAGKAPASYSRFLLPFSYRKSPNAASGNGPRFVPVDAPSAHRRHYLTFETAQVLYDRAKWLELRAGAQAAGEKPLACELTLYRPVEGGLARAIPIHLAPPRLVLFEWPAARAEVGGDPDPFSTGFVVLELSFPPVAVTFDDFCFANELFRYWMRPFEGHDQLKHYRSALAEAPLSLEMWCDPKARPAEDSDIYLDRWAWLLDLPVETEEGSFRLTSKADRDEARRWVTTGQGKSGWMVYSDARTYTWTCAVVPGGGDGLAESRAWTQLLNMDPPGWGELTEFEKGWTKERTYPRWVEGGSLYGFTKHSGAALLPPWTEPPLWQHFGDSYFDQALLLLYARVGLFRFSRWLSKVSVEARDRGTALRDSDLEAQLSRIRKNLTLFANLYEFPLLSSQQQGIEMYALARKVMDIEVLGAELGEQVRGSHELLDMLADQEEARAATRLSVVAAIGLPFALATGFLGMNLIADDLNADKLPDGREWGIGLGVLLVFSALLAVIYGGVKHARPLFRRLLSRERSTR